MAKLSRAFDLDVTPTVASRAAREAIRGAGWNYEESGEQVEAREDVTRLCCKQAPVTVQISVREQDSGTEIRLEGRLPGWGPIPSRQLPDRLRMLERTIRERSGVS
jgi:hypothetical protein